jgi:haloalkane dehalogenase
MISLLKNNGFRVIAPDLIGFGKSDKFSDKNKYTYESSVRWTKTFIEKLDLKEIILFCQDWGGLIGLRVASVSSNRFAMIIASNTALPTGDPKMPEEFINWLNFSQNTPEFNTGAIVNMGTLG